jgi:hypothetical protein
MTYGHHGFPVTLCCECHGAVDTDNYAEDSLDVWCSHCWSRRNKAIAADRAEQDAMDAEDAQYAAEQEKVNG